MRSRLAWLTTLAAGAAIPALAGPALAQTFPADADYTPLPCGDDVMTDRHRDTSGSFDERDLVGDGGHAAGLRALDDQFLYLRLRLDKDPNPGGNIQPFAWGVELDVNRNRNNYEILCLVDGVTGSVLLYENTTTTVANDPTDPADTPAVMTYPLATHASFTTAAGSQFGGDDDFFLSFAIPWADLRPLGLDTDTPVRVWAASSDMANLLNGDFACHDGAGGGPNLSDIDSDDTVLDPEVDSDGDGHTDAEEVESGSNPNDPNSVPGGGGNLALAGGGGCVVGAGRGPTSAEWVLATLCLLILAIATCRPRSRA